MEKWRRLLVLGISVLVATNTLLVPRLSHAMNVDVLDGLRGLGYGLSIGILIMAIRTKTKVSQC